MGCYATLIVSYQHRQPVCTKTSVATNQYCVTSQMEDLQDYEVNLSSPIEQQNVILVINISICNFSGLLWKCMLFTLEGVLFLPNKMTITTIKFASLVYFSGYEYRSIYIQMLHIYTGCPGCNVPDFDRMFLTLKYTDLTQNTYIRR